MASAGPWVPIKPSGDKNVPFSKVLETNEPFVVSDSYRGGGFQPDHESDPSHRARPQID